MIEAGGVRAPASKEVSSADDSVVASGCEDGVVRVYNGTNGTLLKAALPPDAEPKK